MNKLGALIAAAVFALGGFGATQETLAGSGDGYALQRCGGIAGLVCSGANEYCDISGQCGVADALGTCRPRPDICTADFNPVCGCDGQTYSNACSAAAVGVSVASLGECPGATYN